MAKRGEARLSHHTGEAIDDGLLGRPLELQLELLILLVNGGLHDVAHLFASESRRSRAVGDQRRWTSDRSRVGMHQPVPSLLETDRKGGLSACKANHGPPGFTDEPALKHHI